MFDAAKILDLIETLNVTQAEFARRVGVSQPTVSRWLKGAIPDPQAQAKLTDLALEHDMQAAQAAANYRPPPKFLADTDIPVFSAVEGGIGEIVVSTDPIYSVPRPWYLHNAPGYAVLVTGDSMAPVYEPGDMVVVNPRLPPVPGKQAIFIEGADNGDFTATVKRFLRSTPEHWHVQQFNPAKEFTLPKKRWTKALRIVGKYDGG